MPINPYIKNYLLAGIEATPNVLDALLADLAPDDPRWDLKPDPDRFTLREIVAHLADWDPIFLGRGIRIRDEEEPVLPDCDEGRLAIDNDYAHQSPDANRERLRTGREELVAFFRSLPEEGWDRAGYRPPVLGRLTLQTLAVLVLAHDGYHAKQITDWLITFDR